MLTATHRKPIDLPSLVAARFRDECLITRDEIEQAVTTDVEAQIGHALSEWHRGQVGLEVGIQWNAREEKVAHLRTADDGESTGDLYSGDDE
jgi:hypothetical protein